MKRCPAAILLLGPTGSGKTPLGECLSSVGIHGHRCHHFDFGEQLRQAAAGSEIAGFLGDEDLDFIRRVLNEGLLLERETFYIAEHLLKAFCRQRDLQPDEWLVLNGLPRHVDQARDVAGCVQVGHVVLLDCPVDVVLERLERNSGGDRTERTDDGEALVRQKLEIFRDRTLPLVDHYKTLDVPVTTLAVTSTTHANDLAERLQKKPFRMKVS